MVPHINLVFPLFSTEGWSDYITALCVAVILPPRWWASSKQPLLCHARRRQNHIDVFLLLVVLIHSERLRCYGIVNTALLPPLPSSVPALHRFPRFLSICEDKWNQMRSAVLLVPDPSPVWMELTVESCHDCPKQSRPGSVNAGWSGAALNIIITLKDLRWQRGESQQGLRSIAVCIAPSVDFHREETDGMFVHTACVIKTTLKVFLLIE